MANLGDRTTGAITFGSKIMVVFKYFLRKMLPPAVALETHSLFQLTRRNKSSDSLFDWKL
jgi:hypothetical protein